MNELTDYEHDMFRDFYGNFLQSSWESYLNEGQYDRKTNPGILRCGDPEYLRANFSDYQGEITRIWRDYHE